MSTYPIPSTRDPVPVSSGYSTYTFPSVQTGAVQTAAPVVQSSRVVQTTAPNAAPYTALGQTVPGMQVASAMPARLATSPMPVSYRGGVSSGVARGAYNTIPVTAKVATASAGALGASTPTNASYQMPDSTRMYSGSKVAATSVPASPLQTAPSKASSASAYAMNREMNRVETKTTTLSASTIATLSPSATSLPVIAPASKPIVYAVERVPSMAAASIAVAPVTPIAPSAVTPYQVKVVQRQTEEVITESAPAEVFTFNESSPMVMEAMMTDPLPRVAEAPVVEPLPEPSPKADPVVVQTFIEQQAVAEPVPTMAEPTPVETFVQTREAAFVQPVPAVQQPSPAVYEQKFVEPSPAVYEQPSSVVYEQPSSVVYEQPSSVVYEQPSVVYEKPSPAVYEQPSVVYKQSFVEPSPAVQEQVFVEPSPAVQEQVFVEPSLQEQRFVEPVPAVQEQRYAQPMPAVQEQRFVQHSPAVVYQQTPVAPISQVISPVPIEPLPVASQPLSTGLSTGVVPESFSESYSQVLVTDYSLGQSTQDSYKMGLSTESSEAAAASIAQAPTSPASRFVKKTPAQLAERANAYSAAATGDVKSTSRSKKSGFLKSCYTSCCPCDKAVLDGERERKREGAAAAAAAPTGAYLVDNSQFMAATYGLHYRRQKLQEDSSLAGKEENIVKWGTIVQGKDHGDGWLECEHGLFVPMEVDRVKVLSKVDDHRDELYVLSNNELGHQTHGIGYRKSKQHADKLEADLGGFAPWGTTVRGTPEGEWLRTGNHYLPMSIEGKPVVVKNPYPSVALPQSAAPPKTGSSCFDGLCAGKTSSGEYLVDNSLLKANTWGLHYRPQKSISDMSLAGKEETIAKWGTTVTGKDHGDGWLECKKGLFLPCRLSGMQVLTKLEDVGHELYVVDNNELQHRTHGVGYRTCARMENKVEPDAGTVVHWGTTVRGTQQGDFLRVGNQFLPMRIEGKPVIIKKPHPALEKSSCFSGICGGKKKPGDLKCAEYLVDNSELKGETLGLYYRVEKNASDEDNKSNVEKIVPWGCIVEGIDHGDMWLECKGGRFLPMSVYGARVLAKVDEVSDELYVIHNGSLRTNTDGLAYRKSKELWNRRDPVHGAVAYWGSTVRGVQEGEWLRVGTEFLPMALKGHTVILKRGDL